MFSLGPGGSDDSAVRSGLAANDELKLNYDVTSNDYDATTENSEVPKFYITPPQDTDLQHGLFRKYLLIMNNTKFRN